MGERASSEQTVLESACAHLEAAFFDCGYGVSVSVALEAPECCVVVIADAFDKEARVPPDALVALRDCLTALLSPAPTQESPDEQ